MTVQNTLRLGRLAVLFAGAAIAVGSAGGGQAWRPGIVILKDGTHMEAESVVREESRLVVTLSDGRTLNIDTSQVALFTTPRNAGDRPQSTPQPGGGRGLGAIAGSITLQRPADGRRLDSMGAPAMLPDEGDARAAGPADEALPPSAARPGGTPDLRPLESELASLSSSWHNYPQRASAVKDLCSGYLPGRTGGSGCGGPGGVLMSRRRTPQCREAIADAAGALNGMDSRYQAAWQLARKAHLLPGEMRGLLAQRGLSNINAELRSARSALDAWSRDPD